MDKRELINDCAKMFEKYYSRLSGSNDMDKIFSLDKEDMKFWNTYYPELQNYTDIHDADFFQPPEKEKNPNYGVGKDGQFGLYEYCNIRYQLYRCMAQERLQQIGMKLLPEEMMTNVRKYMKMINIKSLSKETITLIIELIIILESYVPQIMHKGTQDLQLMRFTNEQKKIWDTFYELNSKMNLIPDGEFFGNIQSNPNYGIGKDGAFFGVELLHFLGNCYKKISQLLN